jgi:hypothetical protein
MSGVPENGISFACYQPGVSGGFDEHLVSLLDIAAHDKALVILVKPIKPPRAGDREVFRHMPAGGLVWEKCFHLYLCRKRQRRNEGCYEWKLLGVGSMPYL